MKKKSDKTSSNKVRSHSKKRPSRKKYFGKTTVNSSSIDVSNKPGAKISAKSSKGTPLIGHPENFNSHHRRRQHLLSSAGIEVSKKHLKAFLAGMFFPAVMIALLMPVGLTLNLPIYFLYFFPLSPIVWGFWNLLYTDFINYFPARHHLGLAGAILGLIFAVINVFFLGIPQSLNITGNQVYAPLFVIPLVYYIVWRIFVHPVNQALGVHD